VNRNLLPFLIRIHERLFPPDPTSFLHQHGILASPKNGSIPGIFTSEEIMEYFLLICRQKPDPVIHTQPNEVEYLFSVQRRIISAAY